MTRQQRKCATMVAAAAISVLSLMRAGADPIDVPNGEFNIFKPGTTNTVGASLPGGNVWAKGLGENVPVNGGSANYDDGTTGTTVDCPGWISIHGVAPDLLNNGVGGTIGFNAFASWGGDVRAESSQFLGPIVSGATYTITAMINGGVANGPLAFHLMAGGLQMTPSSQVDPVTPVSGWQTISRTYDATAVAGHVGEQMTIIIGVEDANDIGGRMIYDNITLDADIPAGVGTVLLVR